MRHTTDKGDNISYVIAFLMGVYQGADKPVRGTAGHVEYWQMSRRRCIQVLIVVGAILAVGFFLPEARTIPVAGASTNDWNHDTFWFEPWGRSGVHKGIDIFAAHGTPVISTNMGFVLYAGELERGGKVVLVLGPKWRLHYYAHLQDMNVSVGSLLDAREPLGHVGDTGNARGKQPHLHYSILRLFPAPWAMDSATQGHKKAFFINPHVYLTQRE